MEYKKLNLKKKQKKVKERMLDVILIWMDLLDQKPIEEAWKGYIEISREFSIGNKLLPTEQTLKGSDDDSPPIKIGLFDFTKEYAKNRNNNNDKENPQDEEANKSITGGNE